MKPPETIEEELAIISDALAAGIDPFKPLNNHSRVGKLSFRMVFDITNVELGFSNTLSLCMKYTKNIKRCE